MKKSFLFLPLGFAVLASCGETSSSELTQPMTNQNDFEEAALSFEEGGAADGEAFFFGVQAEVVEIDVKFREVNKLDEEDAALDVFTHHLDTMLSMIEGCKKAMNLYDGKGWPKQQELEDITIEWLDAIGGLVTNHLRGLAGPMGIPDEEWTDDNLAAYEEYSAALDAYYEVDQRWVDFQLVYAEANGFTFGDETIDIDALVEEDMAQ